MTSSVDPDGFFRSHLIWIYPVCKGKNYSDSAGQGIRFYRYCYLLLCCCLTSTVNNYGHVEMVSKPDLTFPGQA